MVSANFFFTTPTLVLENYATLMAHNAKVSAEKFYNAKAITAPRVSAEETDSSFFIFLFPIIESENFFLTF